MGDRIKQVKELTFHMGDKTEDELWEIVRDACRSSTKSWRAYEKIHGKFTHLKNMYASMYRILSKIRSEVLIFE